MRLPETLLFLLTLFTTIHAFAIPDLSELSTRDLFKRKGGGGGKGPTGSSGSSGSKPGNTGSGSGSGITSSSSNAGGRSASGSGPSPSFGRGGGYYSGGAQQPYKAGRQTSSGLAAPLLLGGTAALLIFPGIWAAGAYAYAYPHPWYYHNDTSNQDEQHPVQCLCAADQECGCDDTNNDTDFVNSVANNQSVSTLANLNGTETLVVNGTLPNGTTAAGGTDSAGMKTMAEISGWWIVVAGVVYTMWFV